METAERLLAQNGHLNSMVFDPAAINRVAEFAERQAAYKTYDEFFDAVGVRNIVPFTASDDRYPIEVLEIRPEEHDPEHAIVYHLPMANPIGLNQTYQAAMIAGSNPNTRVIAIGNPSGGKYDSGRLNAVERKQLRKRKSYEPLVYSANKYIEQQGIQTSDEVGISFGGLKAAVSAYYAERAVQNLVTIEPVMGKRSLIKLGLDFVRSNRELQEYFDVNQLETFDQARTDENMGMAMNLGGLLSLSNLAIANTLKRDKYPEWLHRSLNAQPDMNAHIVWGTESELCTDVMAVFMTQFMQHRFGHDRVKSVRLNGHKHAMANDLHLQSLIVNQSLSKAA